MADWLGNHSNTIVTQLYKTEEHGGISLPSMGPHTDHIWSKPCFLLLLFLVFVLNNTSTVYHVKLSRILTHFKDLHCLGLPLFQVFSCDALQMTNFCLFCQTTITYKLLKQSLLASSCYSPSPSRVEYFGTS